jgi:hypothetical protein
MTHRSNHLHATHRPHTAARARVSREAAQALRNRVLMGALAIASTALIKLITVLVLITSPTSAEYGFV